MWQGSEGGNQLLENHMSPALEITDRDGEPFSDSEESRLSKMHEIWHVCENERLVGLSILNVTKVKDPEPEHWRLRRTLNPTGNFDNGSPT